MMKRHVVGVLLAMSVCGQSFAASSQLLGEQDFANGAIVLSDSQWLTAQANEDLPTTAIYSSPSSITYFHDVDPTTHDAALTFSLWDLDSSAAGNQVSFFALDGIFQPISAFETGKPHGSIEIFQFTVPGSMLSDGAVQVLIVLGPPTNNWVGLDFSRLEVVPEPTTLMVAVSAILALGGLRRRV